MNLSELLQAAIERLEADERPRKPVRSELYTHARAWAIMREERGAERAAAEHDGVVRAEIVVEDANVFGTLRFLHQDGHLHGLLFARRGVHLWAAYAFAGDLAEVDAAALIDRLRVLGTPYVRGQGQGGGEGGEGDPDAHTAGGDPVAGEG